MQIVSLLPSVTEIVCWLGLEDALVGATHACDYPANVSAIPSLTRSSLAHEVRPSEAQRHRDSRQLCDGPRLFELDRDLLHELCKSLALPICIHRDGCGEAVPLRTASEKMSEEFRTPLRVET